MNKIQKMVHDLCPNGVEWKTLGEVGTFYGGLTGKSKKDFENGNAKFITYKNVYSNPALLIDITDTVNISPDEKQNKVQYGDILFTGSSETPDECAMSSVLTIHTDENLYLNSFCFGFRFNSLENINPNFYKHYFRCENARKQLNKTAHGTTRYNVSKKEFAQISIPIPPLAVQAEIVNLLDKFTQLSAELKAELKLRRKQYDYYRNHLLSFDSNSTTVQWMPLGEVGTFAKGHGILKSDFVETGFPCIHYGQVHTIYNTFTYTNKSFISEELAAKCRKAHKGDLIIASTSEDVQACCTAVAWMGDYEVAVSGDAHIFSHNQNPKYMAYLFQTEMFQKQKRPYAVGAKVVRVKSESMEKFVFPFPSLAEQERIVGILDKFETLVNDLSKGLPAEIALVQKQYEYYRNLLLTFE